MAEQVPLVAQLAQSAHIERADDGEPGYYDQGAEQRRRLRRNFVKRVASVYVLLHDKMFGILTLRRC
jgi:hypothetical protein